MVVVASSNPETQAVRPRLSRCKRCSSGMEKNPNRWLAEHRRNLTSDDGEDGILEKILERIPDANRWCVEFGACDGVGDVRELV